MKKILNNKKVLTVFIMFFLLVFLQHQFIWLYHDDYGYATLTYLGGFSPANSVGIDTTFKDIINFCIYHYNNWGGRVLYFFIQCILLRYGLLPIRLIQSIVVTGIFYYIYKIVSAITKKESWTTALLTCSLYGVFEVMSLRGGLFWFTASVLYVWPLLPFLMFVYHYSIKDSKNNILKYILCAILIFMAAFSQEQVSVLALAYIGLYMLYKLFKTRKISIPDLSMCFAGGIGFLIIMLSPGSKIRMSHPTSAAFYELSIFGKLKHTIPNIILENFGPYTRIFTIILFAMFLYVAISNLTKKKNVLNTLSVLSSSIILFVTCYNPTGYFNWLFYYKPYDLIKALLIGLFFVQLGLAAYSLITYLLKDKQHNLIILFIAAILSQGCMVVAPYFPLRSTYMFEFSMFVIFIYIFTKSISKFKFNKLLIITPIVLALLLNYADITYGYYRNNADNVYNDKVLTNISEDIKKGYEVNEVHLKKLHDIAYACEMPYIDGFEYINVYIRNYYELPESVTIVYE